MLIATLANPSVALSPSNQPVIRKDFLNSDLIKILKYFKSFIFATGGFPSLFLDRIVFVDRFVEKSVAVNNLLPLQEIVLSVFIR